ncbi:MAG: hypothetical protein GX807_01665 [Erysipelotrichia bacterium]|nr:hypothetical protein [Erysipelotrichia bacterium]
MNNLKLKIESLGLSYNKEILKLVFLNLGFLVLLGLGFYFYRNVLIISTLGAVLILINYLFLTRYQRMIKKEKENNLDEFIKIIAYLEIFISNGSNIYSALNKTIVYASPWTKYNLEKLLAEIDRDKSDKPFIDFAKNYEGSIIENVMISIYQMIDDGENSDRLLQFKFVFDRFHEMHLNQKITKKIKAYDNLNSLPLIGAGFVTFLVTFGIISIIGDLLNVI